jgi:AraC-like DNA-binding protein
MLKTSITSEARRSAAGPDTHRGEALSSRQLLEALERSVPHALSWIVSSFPRGSTQIVQPAKVPQSLLRAYAKRYHTEDRATWQAIIQNKVVADQEIWKEAPVDFEHCRYLRDFMEVGDLRHVAAAPLAGPIFPGYAGAWHVYRSAEQGPFSSSELQQIGKLARQYDQAVDAGRQGRQGRAASRPNWLHWMMPRQMIFDGRLKCLYNEEGLASLDERLREQIIRHARQSLSRLDGEAVTNHRVSLPDSHGDLWIFRAVCYKEYGAFGDGSFIFYCMQPHCKEWAAVRATDLQADSELVRMAPTLQFMHKDFGRGPTLHEIARVADLSPFHFHRRFTEMFGITPKHFLLECQIFAAKTHMALGDKDLVEIANFCGFAHQSHFTSRFKQATGLTPTGWRKMADGLR